MEAQVITKKEAKALREIDLDAVSWPDRVVVSHSVCALDSAGCGWSGFLLEGAYRKDELAQNIGTSDRFVPSISNQICPSCGGTVYRTWKREFQPELEAE
jgi:hypothetical protein